MDLFTMVASGSGMDISSITTALTNGLTDAGTAILGGVATVLPAGLTIFAAIFAIRKGLGVFKAASGGSRG